MKGLVNQGMDFGHILLISIMMQFNRIALAQVLKTFKISPLMNEGNGRVLTRIINEYHSMIHELLVNFIDSNVIHNSLSISALDLTCMKFTETSHITYNLHLYELNLKKKHVFHKRINQLIYQYM